MPDERPAAIVQSSSEEEAGKARDLEGTVRAVRAAEFHGPWAYGVAEALYGQ